MQKQNFHLLQFHFPLKLHKTGYKDLKFIHSGYYGFKPFDFDKIQEFVKREYELDISNT